MLYQLSYAHHGRSTHSLGHIRLSVKDLRLKAQISSLSAWNYSCRFLICPPYLANYQSVAFQNHALSALQLMVKTGMQLRGLFRLLFLYDVAESIDLSKLRHLLGARVGSAGQAFPRRTPGYVRFEDPPVLEA